MKRIEIQCEECGTKEITFTDVTEEDCDKAETAAAMATNEEEYEAAVKLLHEADNTHVMCSSCGHLTKKAP